MNAYYSYAGRAGQYVFVAGEVRFVDAAGHTYEARDLDPSPDHGLLGFEVPATVGSGTLVIGGATQKTSSTGVGYVSQLEEHRVAIDVG